MVRNVGTCRRDVKGKLQAETPQVGNTDARHRDGSARSSGEVSIMEAERRGRRIRVCSGGQLETGGTFGAD